MEKGWSAKGINIGTSSLILILIVLCLVTFGVLSLSSAKSSLNLAERNVAAAEEYYSLDNLGQEFLQRLDMELTKLWTDGQTESGYIEEIAGLYGGQYDSGTNQIHSVFQMDGGGLLLYVAVEPVFDREERYQIAAWKTMNSEEYDIDNSMPVWSGE